VLGDGGSNPYLIELEAAVARFHAREERRIDPRRLRAVISSLEADFAEEAVSTKRGCDHLVDGAASAVSWLAHSCDMSASSVADRVCVGEQLESLPRIAEALHSGELGYEPASVLCHLRDRLEDKKDLFDEEEMLAYAQQFTVKELRALCRVAWHVANPDGFFKEEEADFDDRRLHISQLPNGMHAIDGILDSVGGAALKAALQALSRRLPDDNRTQKQRMADSLVELTQHALDEGRLPKRGGVRPHVSVTTTLEGLKNEVGAPPAEVDGTLPVSTRTLERIACDCTISRVLVAESTVIDVGRATRVVSGPMRRALRVRDKRCRWPGCDRPISWTTPHHIVFVSRRGETNLPNLISVCYFHHRLVHEGGWQIVRAGSDFRFIPPDRVLMRNRGPSWRRRLAA
jgi:hypothetical protein